ncbi:MAG: DUF4190 domain-containing protein [Ilumatobacteraceae bacterium]
MGPEDLRLLARRRQRWMISSLRARRREQAMQLPAPREATPRRAAPGWYPMPDMRQERYWDGNVWTGAFRPVGVAGAMFQSSPQNDGLAIASMVLGIVSLVTWVFGIAAAIVGLVFGAVSVKRCLPHGPKRGRGMAIAGSPARSSHSRCGCCSSHRPRCLELSDRRTTDPVR